ncbi:MAG: 50S ribosomal protein L24 [Candidatus Omnitrophica bacterium]|nr:50S ribosomal protein L24 [Candidatus Omnitrophota bacterium]MDD5574303.1 50S ribosomal protein L24 [Candidatus Omnitrophota bacterium]
MQKIRKGDTVAVITGKDKGKKGKVLRVLPEAGKVLVEGINFVKKHQRKTRQDQQEAGIVQVERPVYVSNLMVVCKNCQVPARVGFSILKDKTKARICKKCNEAF